MFFIEGMVRILIPGKLLKKWESGQIISDFGFTISDLPAEPLAL